MWSSQGKMATSPSWGQVTSDLVPEGLAVEVGQ